MRAIFALVCGLCLQAAAVAEEPGLLPRRVEQTAEDRIAAETYPTLAMGIVDGDKDAVVTFGKLPDGRPPDGDTVYEIGSVTKTFTATLLAEALEGQQVELDTPIAQLLPSIKFPKRGGKEITLLDIATQYSGLPRLPGNLAPMDPANPYVDYDADRLRKFLEDYTLPRDPGASYEYSNLAVGLLGYALASSAKTEYGDLVAREIFKPLGMQMSGISFTDAMLAHLAPATDQLGHSVKNWDINVLAGAGGIRSSTNDMVRYLKANMGLIETPLLPAMKLAQQPRRDIGKTQRIGLIWMTREDPDGIVAWHPGMTGGYAAFIGFVAERHRGVVILANSNVSVDDLGFAVLRDDAPLPPVHKAIVKIAEPLEDYVGVYKSGTHLLWDISCSDQQLYAQETGQDPFPIFSSGPNEFFSKIPGVSMSFSRGENDTVTGFVLHLSNGDHVAPKLEEPKAVALDASTLASYVGRFEMHPGIYIDVTLADGQLSIQLTGQSDFAIYPSAKDRFFLKLVEAQIVFERDTSGKVQALVLHQDGQEGRAPRIP